MHAQVKEAVPRPNGGWELTVQKASKNKYIRQHSNLILADQMNVRPGSTPLLRACFVVSIGSPSHLFAADCPCSHGYLLPHKYLQPWQRHDLTKVI